MNLTYLEEEQLLLCYKARIERLPLLGDKQEEFCSHCRLADLENLSKASLSQ